MASQNGSQNNNAGTARKSLSWHRTRLLLIVLTILLVSALLFDAPVTRALTSWPEGERAFFAWLTRWGESDWILIPAALVAIAAFASRWLPLNYTDRWAAEAVGAMAGFVFLGVGAPGLFTAVMKRILGRARPLHLDDLGTMYFDPIQWDWSLAGFPSGHATTSFAFATVLVFLLGRRIWWVYIVAAMIALSRIVTGMHFPTDVAVGIAVGTIGAFLVRRIYIDRNWVFRREGDEVRNRMLTPVVRYWRRLRR